MPVLSSPFPAHFDRWLRVAGPIVLFLTGLMFFRLKMYVDLPRELWLNQVTIALSAGFIGWELSRFTALYIQLRLPGLQLMTRRLIYLAIAVLIIAHIGYAIRYSIHNFADNRPWKWPSLLDYSDTTGVLIFYTVVTLGIYEGAYIWQQWKKTFTEKEKLFQSEWQAKYDLLQSQINPHFLFNSLNSLSSLIAENPAQAEKFADEMSSVYRYLLKNNDQELVTLSKELQFIRSYGHLLSIRHGSGFCLCIDVDNKYYDYLLPSLTLQLLVENAVKHNTLSKDQPLTVKIRSTEDEKLIVENYIRKKTIVFPSTGVGLANINSRYRLLEQGGISIHEEGGWFVVSIPLIRNIK